MTHPILEHLEREFRIAGLLSGTSALEDKLVVSLRGLATTFIEQEHTHETGSMTLTLFDRIVQGKPLVPLYGAPAEWERLPPNPEDPEGPVAVNKRCRTVFKYAAGHAVDVGMLPLYVDQTSGRTFNNPTDRPPVIQFPYMPGIPETIAVDAAGNVLGA